MAEKMQNWCIFMHIPQYLSSLLLLNENSELTKVANDKELDEVKKNI